MEITLQPFKLHLVESFSEAEDFLRWLGESRRPYLGCDTEGSGFKLYVDKLRLVQFGDLYEGWAIPYERWSGLVKETFGRYRGQIVFHNAPHDISFLKADGVQPYHHWTQIEDTHPLCFLRNNQASKKLADAAWQYAGWSKESAWEGDKALKKYFRDTNTSWDTVPVDAETYWQYGCIDAIQTCQNMHALEDIKKLYPEAYDLEMAASKVLIKMKMSGIRIDREYVDTALSQQKDRLIKILPALREAGIVDNNDDMKPNGLNEAKPIIRIFRRLGVEMPTKITKKGKVSVDDEVLETTFIPGTKKQHPLASALQEARKTKTNITNYFEKILEYNSNDRVHASINQLEALSGRMSVTDPPLHAMPKDPIVRDSFLPDEGTRIMLIDYQNMELRIIGSLCKSKGMMEAFEKGENMHRKTAAKAWGIPMEEVTDDQYQLAKRSMFTFGYGGQAKKFSEYVGEMGTEIFNQLHALYPEVGGYMEDKKHEISITKGDTQFGFTHASDGRRIYIPAYASYKALSYTSQCEGALIIKRALVELDAAGLGDYLKLPIHDELMFNVPEDDIKDVMPEAKKIMETRDYIIPLTCDTSVVDRWGDEYRAA